VTILLSLIFIATMLSLTGAAFALILKNLSDINKLNKPRKVRLSHPELEGVKQGESLTQRVLLIYNLHQIMNLLIRF